MPQPTRRRNLRKAQQEDPKQDKNNSNSDSSSDYENRKYRKKAPNKTPKKSARKKKKDDSLARDVDKIRSANVTYKKRTMYRLERLQGRRPTSSQNLPEPHNRPGKKKKEMLLSFLVIIIFVALFVAGHYVGYRYRRYVDNNKKTETSFAVERIEEASWKKDSGELCKNTIGKIELVVNVNWSAFANISMMSSLAIFHINENRQMTAILLQYVVILIEHKKTPIKKRNEAFQEEILDNLLLAQLSLELMGDLNLNQERLTCATHLWLSITQKVIDSHVNTGMFRQAWYKVSQAITYSQLRVWDIAIERSEEAMTMIKTAYGNDASKYEVYDWACYINYVANEKYGKQIPKKVKARLLAAANKINSAQDKLAGLDSMKIFNVLFPYKLPQTKTKNR